MNKAIFILRGNDAGGKEFVLASTSLTPVKKEAAYQIHKGSIRFGSAGKAKSQQIRDFREACKKCDFKSLETIGIKKVFDGHKTY